MKITIFTEGGSKIGFGHLSRCYVIAKKISEINHGIKVYLIINGDREAENFFRANQVKFTSFNWRVDLKRSMRLAETSCAVLIDSYLAPESFYKMICSLSCPPVLSVIDDYNRINYKADILINHTVCGVKKMGYKNNPNTEYLIGNKYIILRDEFCSAPRKEINKIVRNVLVTFGGMDYAGFIKKVARTLVSKGYHLHIISPSLKMSDFRGVSSISLYRPLKAKDMLKLMQKVDICVSAGGQTLNELAAIGVPTIGICFSDNQIGNLKYWEERGFLKNIGRYNDRDVYDKLVDNFRILSLRRNRVRSNKAARLVVDGLGAQRIALAIINKSADYLAIREVQESDCFDILKWRNHPLVRQQSFNQDRISRSEHKRWFDSCAKSANTKIFVATSGNIKVGVIRFCKERPGITVSVNVNPDYFRKGFGTSLIKLGTQRIIASLDRSKPIIAHIKKENRISRKAFSNAGYVRSACFDRADGSQAYSYKIKR